MKILVDTEEGRSSVPAQLVALGVTVEILQLPVGDYLVASGIAVERKSISDLHRSLENGRLWSQVSALRRELNRAYLLVEGRDLDVGRVSSSGVRGALLHIVDQGIPVIRSIDPADSARWLCLIAKRAQRAERGVEPRRRGRRRMVASPAGVLATVPGISPSAADRVLARFGSIAAAAAASEAELRRVEGIGPVRAAALVRLLRGE